MPATFAAKATLVLVTSLLLTQIVYFINTSVLFRKQLAAQHRCAAMTSTAAPPPMAARKQGTNSTKAAGLRPNSKGDARKDFNNPNEQLSDPYAWLRDDSRSSPEVLQYLQAENTYADAYFKPLQHLVDDITHDVDMTNPDVEVSAPKVHHGYVYYNKRGPGQDYWDTYRRPLLQANSAAAADGGGGYQSQPGSSVAAAVASAMAAAQQETQQLGSSTSRQPGSTSDSNASSSGSSEELVLDQNSLSPGHTYWDVVSHEVSPDGLLVAYLVDTVGDENFALQVLEVASGRPLLSAPVTGCGETLLWWGTCSDTLAFSVRTGNSNTQLRLLRLSLQQQQQQAVLYEPEPGERGLSLSLSHDRQFVILTSSVEGDTQVTALPCTTPLNFSSSSSSDPLPLAVPAAAWWPLVLPEDGLDVLTCQHLGSSSSSSSTCGGGSSGGGSSGGGSSSSSMFVALVDSDDAPDGEVVLIQAAAPGSTQGMRTATPSMEVLVGNYDARYESSSSSSNSDVAQEEDANNSKHHHKQPHQRQQEGRTSGSLPALELRSFSLHPSRSHIAVGVRRQGVCAVDVYHMPEPAAAAAVADIVTAAAEAAEAAEAAAEAAPQIYTLHTKPSSSGSNGSGNTDSSNAADVTASASTAAIASAAATAGVSAARLSWVLVLDEPTLVSEVLGVMTKHDITRAAGVTHAGADSLSDSWLAISVSGITSPTTVYYVNMKDPQQQVQVYQEAVVGFDPSAYTSQLEWAVSADGVAVPLTVAYRRGLMKRDGSNKAILHAYGAYGSSQWPSFNPADVALLDRGVVLAICHVRGGGELGSAWHTSAQKLNKKRTFQDLLACASHLATAGYSSSRRMGLWGRSAGGLTLGAVLNMQPGVAAAAVLDVPFLDVLGDMSDPELPLTLKERGEWGDPLASQAVRGYISSYSPLHNLSPSQAADYPALLLTGSLHDTRVNFWEPAKYVATLRHLQQQQQQQQQGSDSSSRAEASHQKPLLLLTDLHAGHFAASGASSKLQERAVKVAFLLHNLDCSAVTS